MAILSAVPTKPARLFIAQQALEAMLDDSRAQLDGTRLTLKADGLQFETQTGVWFRSEVSGAADAANLVGKVKTLAEMESLGAELCADSVILGDNAYEVTSGLVGTVLDGPSEAGPSPAPASGGADLDLLAQFLLGKKGAP